MSDRPFIGNIEYAIAEGTVLPAALYYSVRGVSGLQLLMIFTDSDYEVSPTNWEAADIDYDYESVTNVLLHKVKKWRPYWTVKQNYADRDNWIKVCRSIMSLMNKTGHTFSSTGVVPVARFWFYPPGDAYRPRVEVVIGKRSTEIDEYLGNRYIGFSDFEIVLRGANIYDEQHIASKYIGLLDVDTLIVSPAGSLYVGAGVSS